MKTALGMIGLAGFALAMAGPVAAQGAQGGRVADLPVTAMQNGRTVASTRTDARGGFVFDLPDPRDPPINGIRVAPQTVTVTGTLSLEPRV